MVKHKKIIILLSFLMVGMGFSQSKVGTAGANFLSVSLDPNASAMGGAYVAVANDPLTVFWNIAGVANIKSEMSAGFSYVSYLAETNLGGFSIIKKLGLRGNLAIFVGGFNSGDIEGAEISESGIIYKDPFQYRSAQIGIGFARYFTDKFASGVALKLLHENVSGYASAYGVAIDVGTYFWTGFKSLRIAMSMQNIGPDMKFSGTYLQYLYQGNEVVTEEREHTAYPIPLNFRLGMAMEVIDDPVKRLTLSLESNHPNDYDQTLALGFEFSYMNMFFVRGGYNFMSDADALGLGFGVNLKNFSLNYSFTDMQELTDVHRISISYVR